MSSGTRQEAGGRGLQHWVCLWLALRALDRPPAGKDNPRAVEKERLEEFRKKLEDVRTGIRADMRLLEEEVTDPHPAETSHLPSHLADLSADDHETGISIQGLERGSEELAGIEEALRRMEDGKFGECEECGRNIPLERLDALPYATLCIECKREQESHAY
jgi:DnaK suppressor protein